MASAPSLHVFHSLESVPEFARAHKPRQAVIGSPRWGGVEEAMAGACKPALVGALCSAHRGRGQHVSRETAMAAPPLAHHLTVALCFCVVSLGFLHEHSWLWSSSLPSPQAVSSQPTAVPFPGLLSIPHIPAPSPPPHQQTPFSGWGTQGCSMDRLYRSHSVLPQTSCCTLL